MSETCRLCGETFPVLGQHVRVHGLTIAGYRQQEGALPRADWSAAYLAGGSLAAVAALAQVDPSVVRAHLGDQVRPRGPVPRQPTRRMKIALTAGERETIQRAAARAGTDPSGFVRDAALRAARRTPRHAKKPDGAPRGPRAVWTAAQRQQVVTGYAAGRSLRELALAFNCGPPAISALLRGEGVTLRPTGKLSRRPLTPEKAVEVERLVAGGMSARAAADRVDASHFMTLQHLARRGLVPDPDRKQQPPGDGRPHAKARLDTWVDVPWVMEQVRGGRNASAVARDLGVSVGAVTALLRRQGNG